ncbi:MAG: GNAT family N-acetyltransferase [Pseudomonadota bacterium]
MNDSITYRKPTEADAEALVQMVDELTLHEGDERGHFTVAKALADVIAPDAPVDCLIAARDGAPIGYAFWHFGYESSYAARGSYLADLYVREAARASGVGEGLLREVARATKAAGGIYVWWTAYRTNERARAFYRKRAEEEDGIVAYALTNERFERLLIE